MLCQSALLKRVTLHPAWHPYSYPILPHISLGLILFSCSRYVKVSNIDPRAHKRKGEQEPEAGTSRSDKGMGDKRKGKRLVRAKVVKDKPQKSLDRSTERLVRETQISFEKDGRTFPCEGKFKNNLVGITDTTWSNIDAEKTLEDIERIDKSTLSHEVL